MCRFKNVHTVHSSSFLIFFRCAVYTGLSAFLFLLRSIESMTTDYPHSASQGARLGLSDHLDDNLKVFEPECRLTREDREAIEDVLAYSNGRKIITTIGDCGAEYR
jgi:hypothetical protein